MIEKNHFDDRPPIEVEQHHTSLHDAMRAMDHGLGYLELAATHARNQFREMVASTDVATNEILLRELQVVLGEAEKLVVALRGDFAAFDAAHGE